MLSKLGIVVKQIHIMGIKLSFLEIKILVFKLEIHILVEAHQTIYMIFVFVASDLFELVVVCSNYVSYWRLRVFHSILFLELTQRYFHLLL